MGVVENVAYDGSVLVRAQFAPTYGTRVVDKRNRPVGKVVKVFGPVREPFASIRPEGKVALSVLGSDMFVSEGNDARQESRRGRRSH
ncbi:MAG: H/ACA RNA-protein complex protein Gar1 [Methanobacteriota archaeon]|nr:MAG: H/ACA RNA-protein complex protein Gar1 [Euryarchaeota archaeon]